MRALIRSLLILVLLAAPAVQAGSSWEFAGWYGGGCFPNIEFDPQVKGRLYLTSDVAGIWRSNDDGDHWHFVTKGLENLTVAQVAVAPSDSNILYAATGSGLFVSKNAGDEWAKAGATGGTVSFVRPASYRAVAVDPSQSGRVCMGSAQGQVFCSKDFGASWTDIDSAKNVLIEPKPVRAVAFDQSGKNLFVASSKGMVRCSIDASTCAPLTAGPAKVTDFVIGPDEAIYAAGEERLWISRDQGVTWAQSQPVPKGAIDRVALDASSDLPVIRVLWVKGWDGGVYISRDLGSTWKSQDQNMKADAAADPSRSWARNGGKSTALKVDPFNADRVFRTDWWGVWRSDDGGLSWSEKIVGAPNTVVTQVTIAPDGAIYAASMDNGLLRSTDGGKTYQPLFPVKGYEDSRNGHVWRVALAGDTIIATSSPWNKKINQVIVSKDNGQTFTQVTQGLPDGRPGKNTMWGEGYPRGLAVDPRNPQTVYLGIDGDETGGLFVSRDAGLTWQRSAGQPGSRRIYYGLAVDPTDSNRIIWGASGAGGGVYVSEDAGLTFVNNLKQMQWVFDVAVSSDGTIYAAGDSSGAKLYVSRNHGRSWSLLGSFEKGRALGSVAVNPSNPKQVAVSTVSWNNKSPCKIYLSSDAGKTWDDVTGFLPDGAGAASLTFDPQNKYLYAGRAAGSIYRLRLE